jgi:hypothetical protein
MGVTSSRMAASRRLSPGRRASRFAFLILGLGLGAGCSGPPGAGRELGRDLGSFHVAASELHNDCGEGSLGSSERFEFDVDLARADSELFWNGRVGGRVGSALDFEIRVSVAVPLREATSRDAGCTIGRADRIAGQLGAGPAGDITAFEAELEYAFSIAADSACTLDDQLAAGLVRLPCAMRYALRAARTRAPEQSSP